MTNWRVLIIPEGIRLQVQMGKEDADIIRKKYQSTINEKHLEVKYVCTYGEMPKQKARWSGNLEYTDKFKQFKKSEQTKFGKENNVSLVPENIIDIIKTTCTEYLDVVVERSDIDDYDDFSHIVGSGPDGAIEILTGSDQIQLVRGSYKEMFRALQNDHRFHRLTDEGKEKAKKRLADESKMKDATLILQWVERLEAYRKSKVRKSDSDVFNSVLDGLK